MYKPFNYKVAASDLGALLGYLGPDVQHAALMRTICKSTYAVLLRPLTRDHMQAASTPFQKTLQSPHWPKVLAIASRCETLDDMADAEQAANALLLEVQEPERERALRWVRSKASCSYGLAAEKAYITDYNLSHVDQIVQTQHSAFKGCSEITPTLLSTIMISGRTDGITRSGELIEVKHRTKPIGYTAPQYEIMQLHAYMFLYSRPRIHLAQCMRYRNRLIADNATVHFCAETWASAIAGLVKVCDFIDQLVHSKVARVCFAALNPRERILALTTAMDLSVHPNASEK